MSSSRATRQGSAVRGEPHRNLRRPRDLVSVHVGHGITRGMGTVSGVVVRLGRILDEEGPDRLGAIAGIGRLKDGRHPGRLGRRRAGLTAHREELLDQAPVRGQEPEAVHPDNVGLDRPRALPGDRCITGGTQATARGEGLPARERNVRGGAAGSVERARGTRPGADDPTGITGG